MVSKLTMLYHQLTSEQAATTTEYALLLALVVVTLIGTLTTLGSVLNDKLNSIIQQLSGLN